MSDKVDVAGFNDDRGEELLLKRIPYYGICVATPFILMRHWEEWKKSKTFEIDDKDRELCTLVMEIQLACQRFYFGKQAKLYYENSDRDDEGNRRRASRYDLCYEQLPDEFTTQNVVEIYGLSSTLAASTCNRLKKGGFIESVKKGLFKKLKSTLI